MTQNIQHAGQIKIEHLKLIGSNNTTFDLIEFLVEVNVYEDIFSNFLYGDMVISDSRNLVEKVPILGEELLIAKFTTPSFPSSIEKTFKVYALENRKIVRDNNTQLFTLKFASQEQFIDMSVPLYLPFEGKGHEIVADIYDQYLSLPRKYVFEQNQLKEDENITPLDVLTLTSNSMKFISPGWSPSKCINWIASNSVPEEGVAKNFLFFETNKSFVFTTIENIFRSALEADNLIGTYTYSPAGLSKQLWKSSEKNRINYFQIESLSMANGVDSARAITGGHLANRNIALDIVNKSYKVTDYDHTEGYFEQYHTSGKGKEKTVPVWSKDILPNPLTHISVRTTNPFLFGGTTKSANDVYSDVKGNRLSSLQDLDTIRLNLTVPGRTDVEVGRMLYIKYPALGQQSESESQDTLYSGHYLVTAIHHKINRSEHNMTMEVVKDSLTTADKI